MITVTQGSLPPSGLTLSTSVDTPLVVEDYTPKKVGLATGVVIDATERYMDLTQLLNGGDYPMTIELEARDAACYIAQGVSGLVLSSYNERLQADEYRLITVENASEASVTVKQYSSDTGTLVAVRIDEVA